jgi:hypothetical protein
MIKSPAKQAAHKRWWKSEKGRACARRCFLKRQYGVSQVEWDNLFAAQRFCCASCGVQSPGKRTNWHTDHDHKTGRVRGILCARCNLALGVIENVELVSLLRLYQETHS